MNRYPKDIFHRLRIHAEPGRALTAPAGPPKENSANGPSLTKTISMKGSLKISILDLHSINAYKVNKTSSSLMLCIGDLCRTQ